MIRTKGYIVDVCTDRALDFIDRNKSKPFLCYVPFTTPHSPWAAPESNWNQFKEKPITQRATVPEQESIDQTRCALAMIENQDANVGRVLSKLEELKISENTIVLYFSDNGPNSARWTGGMKGRKGTTDEGGVRSVCFIRWPAKLPAGHTVTEIAGAIDLLPTLTSLCGVTRVGDKPLDGRDLSPLMLKQKSDWPDRMIFTTWAGKVSVRTQKYRLDDRAELFDMIADPGQATSIAKKLPDVTERLKRAVEAWREEMTPKVRTIAESESKGKKKNAGGNAVDPRPIPVGYAEFPITMLPARDGEPLGEVNRSSGAPNCSYFVNWKRLDDSMVWLVDIHTTGRYEVVIDYTCPIADTGSLVELSSGDSRLTGRVSPGWDPPLYTNQDTLPRPTGESQMKEFRPLKLGEIRLEKGESKLILRATEIPGKSVMDVRRVTLTLLP